MESQHQKPTEDQAVTTEGDPDEKHEKVQILYNLHQEILNQKACPKHLRGGYPENGMLFYEFTPPKQRDFLTNEEIINPNARPCLEIRLPYEQVKDVTGLVLHQAIFKYDGYPPVRLKKEFVRPLIVPLVTSFSIGSELTVYPYTINGGRPRMSVGYILWLVGREYKRMYNEEQKYEPGHYINDLLFVSMAIYDDGKVSISIDT